MFSAAVADDLLAANPCRVKGATKVRRARAITHIESAELDTLAAKMPEDLAGMVLLAGWCGLRFGELVALDRADLIPDGSTVSVAKGYTRRNGRTAVSYTHLSSVLEKTAKTIPRPAGVAGSPASSAIRPGNESRSKTRSSSATSAASTSKTPQPLPSARR